MVLSARANLAVASVDAISARLREGDTALGRALADAWIAVYRDASPALSVPASELYAALELCAPDLLHALLVPPPLHIPERIRFHDAEFYPDGFTALAADCGI